MLQVCANFTPSSRYLLGREKEYLLKIERATCQLGKKDVRLGCHASSGRVKHGEAIGIRNYGVRPSCGDVFADTVIGGQALDAAGILALDYVSKQFVTVHVINERAADEVVSHVVPINFFTERGKNLGRAKANVTVNNIVSA